MFKSVFGTASMLGIAGMLTFSGCASDSNGSGTDINGSGEHNGATGGIGLALQLADGSDVSTVNYVISKSGVSVRTGTLAIGADGRATGTITGLDAGAGYVVSLEAPRTRDGGEVAKCTGESAPFTVLENQTVPVSVVLQCDDTSAGGNITINGQFNICPKISSASASPSTQAVGSTIALSAAATDKDNDTLTYAWFTGATYSAGSVFASTATATFTCATAGTFTLNVAAYDGDARGCRKALSTPISVTCTGGTPVVDSGTPVVDSGTPVVDSGTPVVDSGTPVVDSGTPVVDSGTPVVDSGAPVVDSSVPPGDTWPYGGTAGAACATCQTTNCTSFSADANPVLADCADSACRAIVKCEIDAKCFKTGQEVLLCYCGGTGAAGIDACFGSGFVPSGACKAEMEASFQTADVGLVLERFADPGYPAGLANRLTTCVGDLCATACAL